MTLPSYYPDSDVIRSDMLDYAVEVEWFDTQLGRMLAGLEEAGELDDTLILVTSDHGMPFPRAKGQTWRTRRPSSASRSDGKRSGGKGAGRSATSSAQRAATSLRRFWKPQTWRARIR